MFIYQLVEGFCALFDFLPRVLLRLLAIRRLLLRFSNVKLYNFLLKKQSNRTSYILQEVKKFGQLHEGLILKWL